MTRRKLVREAAEIPTPTLTELQEVLASNGRARHVTPFSLIQGRVSIQKLFLQKNIYIYINTYCEARWWVGDEA